MKATFLIAASLLVGSAAIAQTTPDPSAAPAPVPDAMAPAPAVTTNASPPADTVAPTASTDTSSYPPCSRSVHDRCVQLGAWHNAHRHG